MRILLFLTLSALSIGSIHFIAGESTGTEPETRAVWLSREVVQSGPSRIYDTFRQLSSAGFNRVLLNAHYFGGTIYPSAVTESAGGPRQLPEYLGRDPLQECIEIGAEFDLEVVAWYEYGLMAYYSAGDTGNSGPILARHPDWEAVDHAGRHWQNNEFGNFHWMDPAHPDVVQFITDLFREAAINYPELGGIETDRIRYPSQDFSYSDTSIALYIKQTGNQDPSTIYPGHAEWADWLDWREAQTTHLAGEIYKAVKEVNPALLVTAAVAPPYMLNQRLKLQAWNVWADSGYIDALEPMLYVNDSDISNQLRESISHVPPGFPLYPGLAHQSDASLDFQISTARSAGVSGVTVWYYGSMTTTTLDMLGTGVFASPAALPHNDLIVDDSDPVRFSRSGNWQAEQEGYRGTSLTAQAGDGGSVAQWQQSIAKTAPYHIFARWTAAPDRATNALYRIQYKNSSTEFPVNQTISGDQWVHLTTDTLEFGQTVAVFLDNLADGTVNADAIRLVIPEKFDIVDINAPDSVNIEIRFNRHLDKNSAEDPANYTISPGIIIHQVRPDSLDDQIIRLAISELNAQQTYTITVNGLKDIYSNTLSVINRQFTFNPSGTYFEIDNGDPTYKTFGTWLDDTLKSGFYGQDYQQAQAGQGENRAQWWAFVGEDGHYEISAWWPSDNQELATNAFYTILHRYGTDTIRVSQRQPGGSWQPLGIFPYAADNACSILLSNKNTDGPVIADAIRIRRVITSHIKTTDPSETVPESFTLRQNYPNPFNPETNIPFDLPEAGQVQIVLFDTAGRRVKMLDSGFYPAGSHSVRFIAQGLASGVYYYSLFLFTGDGFSQKKSAFKKMLLIK